MKVMEKLEPSDIAALESSLAVHQKIKCRSTVYSPIPFLGIYPEELEAGVQRLCSHHVHSSTLLTISQSWAKPNQPHLPID